MIWGVVAIGFAELFRGRETLVEAVNIVGSLFYGTILGIFLAAFYAKKSPDFMQCMRLEKRSEMLWLR